MTNMENQKQLPITIDKQPPLPAPKPARGRWLLVIALLILLIGGAGWYFWQQQSGANLAGQSAGGRTDLQTPPNLPAPSVHGQQVEVDGAAEISGEQEERKQAFGLEQSLDVVVRSDESIVINDTVVPMAEIKRQLDRFRGELSDQNVNPALEQISAWGVYLVRPGDNLWRIHLNLLREYLASQGVNIPPGADQPMPSGYSSGVGKVLKFAEHMVGVYNVKTGQMSHNLNLLEPGEKVVVFNLSEIFAQLKNINPKELDGVMYDGRVLIFPGKTP